MLHCAFPPSIGDRSLNSHEGLDPAAATPPMPSVQATGIFFAYAVLPKVFWYFSAGSQCR
jgi:hypothetical protein